MKKKILITVLLLFTVFVLICMYRVYDYFFPKADVIDYPDYSQIESITVHDVGKYVHNRDGYTMIVLDKESQEALYKYISEAKPTGKRTDHDMARSPESAYCYEVQIEFREYFPHCCGYIYNINRKVYYEIPYHGIYRLNKNVSKLLNN